MRLITGDEIGLIKEIVPELCRVREGEDGRPMPPTCGPSAPSLSAAFAPTSGLAAASRAVRRIDLPLPNHPPSSSSSSSAAAAAANAHASNNNIPGRSRGVVSLAFLHSSSSSSSSSSLDFAALRADGIVETWRGSRPSRRKGEDEDDDDGEGCVTPASYSRIGIVRDSIVRPRGGGGGGEEEEDGGGVGGAGGGKPGWYMERPVRPIGMVSSGNCGIRDKPILATCDSVGGIAVVDADALSVVARYEAFLLPSSPSSSGGGAVPPLPLPSSSRNDPRNAGTLTHTKGGRCNVDIATCLSMNASGTKLAVGGRERGARLLDVETGVVIWKAKNLPPDPHTLLQKLMWTTSMSFLRSGGDGGGCDGGGGAGGGETNDTMACGTACGQVQLYDVRSSSSVRRPSSYTPEGMLEHRITALCQLMGGNVLAAGDAAGDVHLLDLRKLSTGRYLSAKKSRSGEETGLGRLAGPGGSVRQLSAHPNMPHVVSCVGLDRKLWTWDLNARNGKKKPLDCVYLKQRLNCVLFCDDGNYGDDGTTNTGGGNAEEEEGGRIDDDERGGGAGAEGRERDLEDDAVEDYVDSDDDDDDNAGERSAEDDVVVSGSTEETDSDDGEGSGDDDDDEDDDDEDDADDDAVVIASSKRRRT